MKTKLKKLSTKKHCLHCNSVRIEKIYKVKSSNKFISIFFCNYCGLIQSIPSLSNKSNEQENLKAKRTKTISGDANWGNIRHGKQLRLETDYVTKMVNKFAKGNIIDIGSNRGSFIKYVIKNLKFKKITAIEPDISLPKIKEKRVKLINKRFEFLSLDENEYDFVYCCQTLEHIEDINKFLTNVLKIIRIDGVLLIDIPNTNLILNKNLIEEYFIDKHHIHFEPISINSILNRLGFKIIEKNVDSHNMTFICKKNNNKPTALFKKNLILKNFIKERYEKTLLRNRDLINIAFQHFMLPLIKRQKVAIWGISRIYDLFLKFSNLGEYKNVYLVDSYTFDKIKFINKKVFLPFYLKKIEPDVLFVFAQSNEEYISKKAYSMGIRHIIKYSELMDQAKLLV